MERTHSLSFCKIILKCWYKRTKTMAIPLITEKIELPIKWKSGSSSWGDGSSLFSSSFSLCRFGEHTIHLLNAATSVRIVQPRAVTKPISKKKWSGISGNQEQVYLSSKKMLDFNHNTCMHSCIYIYVGLCLHPCELLKCTCNAANGRSYLMNTLTYYKHQIVRSTCKISWVCVCFLLRLHFHRCIALHCIFRSYFSPYITEIKIKPFHICSRNHARIDQRKE